MAKARDYKKEYRDYHGTAQQKKNRAQRNAARAQKVKSGDAKKGDGKDVDHKRPISKGGTNKSGNLRMQSKAKNRGYARTSKNKPK